MYLLHFEKIGLQLKKLVGLLNKLEKSRSILLQDEQIPKHDDILFLISLGTNISSISLRLDWHLCSACLCFQVLYCTAPLAIKSSLEFVVGRTFQNKPRLNWGPLCCKFVFQFCFCFLFFLKLPFFFLGEDCKAISYWSRLFISSQCSGASDKTTCSLPE